MKKILFMAVITALSFGLFSCSNDDTDIPTGNTDNEKSALKVEAGIYGLTKSGPISSFPAGSALGLFITPNTLGNYYDTQANSANVKATYQSSAWSLTPPVLLTNTTAYVYAYYPHSTTATNALAVPVNHTSQTDYMYGKYTNGVSKANPTVSISMKHALAMIQFKLSKKDFPWEGKLTKVEIANKSGKTVLFSEGTMEIAAGQITNTTGKNASASIEDATGLLSIPATASTDEATYPKVLVLPVASSGAAGDILMKFTIDGKVYSCDVPASTVWKAGTKNTYTVTVQGNELKLNANVSIENWTTGVSGSVTPVL